MRRDQRWLDLRYASRSEVAVRATDVLVIWREVRERPPPLVGAARAVLIAPRARRLPGVAAITWVPLASARTASTVRQLRPRGIEEALVHDLESAEFRDVVLALAVGARRIHFTHSGGAVLSASPLAALTLVAWMDLRRRAMRSDAFGAFLRRAAGPRLTPPLVSVRGARRVLVHALRSARATGVGGGPSNLEPSPDRRRVVHYIGALNAGGAQRQLVYLANETRRRGWHVTVATAEPPEGDDGHFRAQLEDAGVEVIWAGADWPRRRILAWIADTDGDFRAGERQLVGAHPASLWMVPILALVRERRPAVVHCWLDDANIVGACAGLLGGAARIVASARSLNPTNSPQLFRRWHRASYRLLAHGRAVRLLANSRAGALDYARWCGVRAERFTVVPNGVPIHELVPLDAASRLAARAALGIADDAFLVVGILRLSTEKRPADFVRAIHAARRSGAPIRALLIGSGGLDEPVRALREELGLRQHLELLGSLDQPERHLAAADACLLPSQFEGCPNVPLEAQALEVPAIVTRGGGAPEVVRDGETGFVCDVGDVRRMGERLAELAHERGRARAMGARGREWVAAQFSVERMVERHLALYED
ncbi:MAG: glycosyltransferase [bacterium]